MMNTDVLEFRITIESLKNEIDQTLNELKGLDSPHSLEETETLYSWITNIEKLVSHVEESCAVSTYMVRRETKNEAAQDLLKDSIKLKHKLAILLSELDRVFSRMPESIKEEFFMSEEMKARSLYFKERLKKSSSHLPSDFKNAFQKHNNEEARAWFGVRKKLIDRISFTVDSHGKKETITGPKALHLMYTSHPDRSFRKNMRTHFQESVKKDAELFASVINQITEITEHTNRILYEEDSLTASLSQNRLTEKTLQALTNTIDKNLARLVPFFKRKAERLGVEKLDEDDLLAPIKEDQQPFKYEEAMKLIETAFNKYSPELAAFAQKANREGWIDAEIRTDKSFIEFCTFLPVSKESRISTMYKGSFRCISTLAHELGHAYHYEKLSDKRAFSQTIPLSIAEFSSTFVDMLFIKEMMEQGNIETRVYLLEEKLKAITLYLLRPYSQFIFQEKLFQRRKNGPLSVNELEDLSVECQRFVYQDALGEYTKDQWISHNLFYIPDKTFYNYPYFFGYLLTAGIHALAEENRFSFERFDALLEESGMVMVEELVMRHFKINLQDEAFWQLAIDYVFQDIEHYLQLT